jgi:excinuclease ABC subunit B
MYADVMTKSMQKTIDETNRRRDKQMAYNEAHGIVPATVRKSREEILKQTSVADAKRSDVIQPYEPEERMGLAADPVVQYMDKNTLDKAIARTEKDMLRAAKEMEYMEAARLRDELEVLKKKREELA